MEVPIISDFSTAFSQPALETEEGCQQAFSQIMQEIQRMNEQIDFDRAEIERLQAVSSKLRDETRSMLMSMGAKF